MSTPAQEPPPWFRSALAVPVDVASVDVGGASIAYRAWGERGRRGIVFVHGGAAHSRWWDHVAPQFAAGWRAVALDLSGHGDSGRRERYDLDSWATEVLRTAEAAGIAGPPIVIGHSMGGFVTLRAAGLFGAALAGAIALDSPVRDFTPEEKAARELRAFGPLRVYPSSTEAVAGFHTIPDEGRPLLPFVVRHVAETSIRQVEGGGWSWKFDPLIFARADLPPSLLTTLDCRVALFRGEHGLLSREMSDVMSDRLGRLAPVIEVPDAGHHIMLDQPLALITGIRALLGDWDHSTLST